MPAQRTVNLTLAQALDQARSLASKGHWAQAESLCSQLAQQVPSEALIDVGRVWIDVLRSQKKNLEACQVLHAVLGRAQWIRVGRQAAPVLLLYGLESAARGEVLFFDPPGGAGRFSINGGHFDCTALMQGSQVPVDRLFLDTQLDDTRLASLRQAVSRYALVINTLADPACEPTTLRHAQRLLEGIEVKVLNAPDVVLSTSRDQMAARLHGIHGLRVPQVLRLDAASALPALTQRLAQHPQGLILRPLDSQTGIGVQRVHDPHEAGDWLNNHRVDGLYATDFHEFAQPDGRYRKYRVFVVDGQILPEHCITADQWNIHSADRRVVMKGDTALTATEQAFLQNPRDVIGHQAWGALQALADRVPLVYFGVDFSVLPSGELLLFEANPAMRVNFDHCEAFPYLRPYLDAITERFSQAVSTRLADTAPGKTL